MGGGEAKENQVLNQQKHAASALQGPITQFLGAVAKLRKAAIRFVISVCPSVRMEQLGFHWADFF